MREEDAAPKRPVRHEAAIRSRRNGDIPGDQELLAAVVDDGGRGLRRNIGGVGFRSRIEVK